MSIGESMQRDAEEFRNRYKAVREEIGRVIVGHDDIVHGIAVELSHQHAVDRSNHQIRRCLAHENRHLG